VPVAGTLRHHEYATEEPGSPRGGTGSFAFGVLGRAVIPLLDTEAAGSGRGREIRHEGSE